MDTTSFPGSLFFLATGGGKKRDPGNEVVMDMEGNERLDPDLQDKKYYYMLAHHKFSFGQYT